MQEFRNCKESDFIERGFSSQEEYGKFKDVDQLLCIDNEYWRNRLFIEGGVNSPSSKSIAIEMNKCTENCKSDDEIRELMKLLIIFVHKTQEYVDLQAKDGKAPLKRSISNLARDTIDLDKYKNIYYKAQRNKVITNDNWIVNTLLTE